VGKAPVKEGGGIPIRIRVHLQYHREGKGEKRKLADGNIWEEKGKRKD